MLRAVPATVFTAESSESQLRSGIFSFAISSTCFVVTVPTLFLFGSADPLAMLAARFSSTAAGGVLVMKLYDRSAYTVTTTGMIRPSSFEVFALKFLQKSMMLTPCGPSAVPTGGAGVALPAAIWSFTTACTFLAIVTLHRGYPQRVVNFFYSRWGPTPNASLTLMHSRGGASRPRKRMAAGASDLFDLQKVQFDGRCATEDRHHHLQRVLVDIHLVDYAIEARERSF